MRARRWGPDLLGVLWVLAAAGAVLVPTLAHGESIGPFDQLSRYGLTTQPGVIVHNFTLGDQISQFIPWTSLAWTQVHHGQLPLWNPQSALGMPLAFNWASGPFSVPAMIGYLFPLHLAYTVQVVVTLAVAGTGVYTLGRVLRLGVLGSVTAATVYELSGPFIGWLGWPHSSVMSWAGWWFAAAVLIVRGRHRVRTIASFAVVLACMVYGGYPEVVVLLALALVVFLAVLFAMRTPRFGGSGPILRPIVEIAVATVAGMALAAPLALPGLQLAVSSRRNQVKGVDTLPAHDLTHVIFQGFDGLPIPGGHWFSALSVYQPSAAYMGVIALVLAVTATGMRRKEPVIVAFAAMAIVMAVLAFVRPVVSVLGRLPDVGSIHWNRALMPMAFALAVLAGAGIDVLVRSYASRQLWRWLGASFAVAGLVLVAVWVVGRGHLPRGQAAYRADSFIWPAVQVVVGLLVVETLVIVSRGIGPRHGHEGRLQRHRGRFAAAVLLVCETAVLISAGAPLLSSSSQFFAPTPGVLALQRAVGSSTVAFGLGPNAVGGFPSLGILPNANDAYALHELDAYDSMIPKAYFAGPPATQSPAAYVFGPAVTTVAQARLYGAAFVLEPEGAPGPSGAVFDMTVGDEDLYRIPGAASATITPISPTGSLPPEGQPGRAVGVRSPDAATWRISTDARSWQVLRLRLTDVPGWSATIDGKPLTILRFSKVMLQARIPPGRHLVELNYWPTAFTVGIALAACSVIGLLAAGVIAATGLRKRRRARPSAAAGVPL